MKNVGILEALFLISNNNTKQSGRERERWRALCMVSNPQYYSYCSVLFLYHRILYLKIYNFYDDRWHGRQTQHNTRKYKKKVNKIIKHNNNIFAIERLNGNLNVINVL